ncbi:hypothetical protein DUI87_22745 [Hirundo rustica rustica]|uniref:Uncharacterized protein n=1 Tax=Hirundo rustica rustica TaxID=333673 RepID=A0A3M0JHT5_HIRRU|nr:hypothetical protein DUI87_22745 [Hirundo rustica rustica]
MYGFENNNDMDLDIACKFAHQGQNSVSDPVKHAKYDKAIDSFSDFMQMNRDGLAILEDCLQCTLETSVSGWLDVLIELPLLWNGENKTSESFPDREKERILATNSDSNNAGDFALVVLSRRDLGISNKLQPITKIPWNLVGLNLNCHLLELRKEERKRNPMFKENIVIKVHKCAGKSM